LRLAQVYSRKLTPAQHIQSLVLLSHVEELRVRLNLLDPFFYHIVLTVVVGAFLEILRVMVDSHSLHSIEKEGLNVQTIEVDDI
jgi:hypothetical protein